MAIVGKSSSMQSLINLLRILMILAILVFIALPVMWILSTSLAERISMFKLPPKLFSAFIFDNFKYVFTNMAINSWITNSLIISFGTMILSLLIGVPAGYAFSRINFRGQNFGLLGTRTAVILIDTVYNAAFTFWLMSGIFESIPSDLEDSGRIDGCNPVQAFLYIAVPLSKPGLVTSALFAFIFSWNDFLFALTLTSPDTTTYTSAGMDLYGGNGCCGNIPGNTFIIIITKILH